MTSGTYRVFICSFDQALLFDEIYSGKAEAYSGFEVAKIQQKLHPIPTIAALFRNSCAVCASKHNPLHFWSEKKEKERTSPLMKVEPEGTAKALVELMQRLTS